MTTPTKYFRRRRLKNFSDDGQYIIETYVPLKNLDQIKSMSLQFPCFSIKSRYITFVEIRHRAYGELENALFVGIYPVQKYERPELYLTFVNDLATGEPTPSVDIFAAFSLTNDGVHMLTDEHVKAIMGCSYYSAYLKKAIGVCNSKPYVAERLNVERDHG